ncbi:hypothetical protein Pmani_011783 [Petrolisthes manimaculis]|uniref:Uncharacterized protein n=1 Tax=Petrolisthes manimaculis TaxID=1843537 RepID=A0AAE1Q0E1_9EUCA|nr:hypothetical protein Pmani_011783 [Petrolisthes manimaculis]
MTFTSAPLMNDLLDLARLPRPCMSASTLHVHLRLDLARPPPPRPCTSTSASTLHVHLRLDLARPPRP